MITSMAAVVAAAAIAGTAAGPTPTPTPRPAPAAAVTGGQTCRAGHYEPVLRPADFAGRVDNPYFPLPLGRTLIYRGIKDGKSQVDRVHVTTATKVIEGITAVAVSDVARHRGKLLEKTTDWYAQDRRGNVWYLGERTAHFLPGGGIDRSGSWQAGVKDAEPGIVMLANPTVPSAYRQECLPGQAEDMAWIVAKGGSLRLPSRTVHNVLVSLEFTRLEPGVVDRKIYAPGIGIVSELAMSGPHEVATLVSVHG
jgi:hypothetical protein